MNRSGGEARGGAPRAVGAFIRAVRQAQNLSQREAAECTRGQPWELSRSAISSIERGRALPSIEAIVALSHVLHIDPAEIIDRVERALVKAPETEGLSREQLESQADELFWGGRFREAVALYETLLAALPAADTVFEEETRRLRGTYELRRAAGLRRLGSLLAARASAERVIDLGQKHPTLQAEGYVVLSAIYRELDNLPLALDMSKRAVELAVDQDEKLQGRVWLQRGACLFQCREYAKATEAFLRTRELIRRSGDARHASHVEGNIGMCWLHQGNRERARIWVRRAIHLARSASLPVLQASWLVELGRIELDRGDPEAAGRCAEGAMQIARPRALWLTVFRAEWLGYLIVRHSGREGADGERLSYLDKLAHRLKRHAGDPTVQEYLAYRGREGDAPGSPS